MLNKIPKSGFGFLVRYFFRVPEKATPPGWHPSPIGGSGLSPSLGCKERTQSRARPRAYPSPPRLILASKLSNSSQRRCGVRSLSE
jgi:hypothetical protein